ncbi:hypothetical protein [Escherichia phage vB_EcoM_EP57]|nr:hypothetical protein [Escherichia phage vB_EcoM_EP57]
MQYCKNKVNCITSRRGMVRRLTKRRGKHHDYFYYP